MSGGFKEGDVLICPTSPKQFPSNQTNVGSKLTEDVYDTQYQNHLAIWLIGYHNTDLLYKRYRSHVCASIHRVDERVGILTLNILLYRNSQQVWGSTIASF